MTAGKQRVAYYDALNVLSCIAVVAMHVNYAYWDYRDGKSWILNCLIEKSCIWAVPVFLMLTGATLIGVNERTTMREYAKRRISRTVLPFLSWSFVALLFDMFFTRQVELGQPVAYYLNLILGTSLPIADTYWFFVPLFSIYLAIPVLSLIAEDRRVKAFGYLAAVSLALGVFRELLPLLGGVQLNADLINPLLGGYLIYPVLGYVLSRIELSKGSRRLLYAAAGASWLLTLAVTIVQSKSSGQLFHYPSDTTLPVVACEASAVFVLVKQGARKLSACYERLAPLAALTFGVYLIHRFVIYLVVLAFRIEVVLWWWPLVGTPVVLAASLGIVWAMKRVPLLRRLV